MEIIDDKVIFPLSVWNDLKKDDYFKELVEALEDRDRLIELENNEIELFDFDEIDAQIKSKLDV